MKLPNVMTADAAKVEDTHSLHFTCGRVLISLQELCKLIAESLPD